MLNYNGKVHLDNYLSSVIHFKPNNAEIIVVDNASTDDSVTYLESAFPEIPLVVLDKNYGFTGGYNKGLSQINAKYYVILNSDVEIKSSWIEAIIDKMDKDESIAAYQPKILSLKKPSHFEYAGAAGGWMDSLGYPFCRGRVLELAEKDEGQYDTEQDIFWATGAALVCRADAFNAFGGFDEDYFAHMEEIDLCWRWKNAGYKIKSLPSVEVFHLGGGTLQYDSPNKIFFNFRNSLFTLFKNEKGSKLLWLFPLRLVLDGLAGLQFIAKGKVKLCFKIIEAHFAFYGNFRKILRKRKATKALINKNRIGAPTQEGKFKGSIIINYFLKSRKTWNRILNSK
ncbi:MAG: glycosyltransferase family 2 protein [Bacteroidota bacterium]